MIVVEIFLLFPFLIVWIPFIFNQSNNWLTAPNALAQTIFVISSIVFAPWVLLALYFSFNVTVEIASLLLYVWLFCQLMRKVNRYILKEK